MAKKHVQHYFAKKYKLKKIHVIFTYYIGRDIVCVTVYVGVRTCACVCVYACAHAVLVMDGESLCSA